MGPMIILIFLTFNILFKEDVIICDYIWVLELWKAIFSVFYILIETKQCMPFCGDCF
jgi:hypothetical protein